MGKRKLGKTTRSGGKEKNAPVSRAQRGSSRGAPKRGGTRK